MKCHINNQKSKASNRNTRQSWRSLQKPVAIYNLAASLFCTAPSLLRTVWDHGRWKLSQSCNCHIAAFCCWDLVSAWEDNFGTSPVQLQQWRPRDWQNYCCSQDKRNYHCIIAGVEFEKYAIDHEMSNQVNATQQPMAIYSFADSLFSTAPSLLRTVWDHGRL